MRPGWHRWRARRQAVSGGEVYVRAWQLVERVPVDRRVWRHHDMGALNEAARSILARAEQSRDPVDYLAALILQAPGAVLAQRSMDKNHGGFRNRETRLYELITFNDTYVSLILALPEQYYASCNEVIKQVMDRWCKRLRSPCFANEQWEAITHGLGREIAVYNGARSLGYEVRMTSRRDDAMGVDMVVTDQVRSVSINLDIKTRSSFFYRINTLHQEGRISELEREEAEKFGHITVVNGHGGEAVTTTLLRIDEETYGRTIHFRLERLEPLQAAIGQIIARIDSRK